MTEAASNLIALTKGHIDLDLNGLRHTHDHEACELGTGRTRWSVSVSIYLLIAFIVGSLAVIATAWAAVRIADQKHGLLRHAFDKGGRRDLAAMAEAVMQIAESNYKPPPIIVLADLPGRRSGDGNVAHDSGMMATDDDRFHRPDGMPSLPARPEPDS